MEAVMSDCWANAFEVSSMPESMDLPEIDVAMLMELLEDALPEEDEDNSLSCVIESLKAEIGHLDPLVSGGELVELAEFVDVDGGDGLMYQFEEEDLLLDWVGMDSMAAVEPFLDSREGEDEYGYAGFEAQAYSSLWQ